LGRAAKNAKLVARRAAKRKVSPAAEWRLAARVPIETYDDYTESMVELSPGQSDPASIEGLIIDFRYVSADGEVTRRSLLCWRCGRVGERIYVRGYCPFREELRTFRIDRMHDLIVFQNGREVAVDTVREFFAAFAADDTDEDQDIPRLASRDG
jgi:hypothetical protein